MAKSWKDLLLSSGLPLEYSVNQLLAGVTGWAPEELKYRRHSVDGSEKIFSIDAASTHINGRDDVWLEMLVECKYRHDGTSWVFVPLASRHDQSAIIAVDQCADVGRVRREALDEVLSPFPLCGKGVEILDNDANPKSIEQAIQQLRYAVAPKVVDALNHQAGHWLGPASPVFLMVPVVVTTATLWVMRGDVGVDEVRSASDLSDVCDRTDALVVEQLPDAMQQDYTSSIFQRQMDKEAFAALNKSLVRRGDGDALRLVNLFARYVPSRFVVVEFGAFAALAGELHRRAEAVDLLESAHAPG